MTSETEKRMETESAADALDEAAAEARGGTAEKSRFAADPQDAGGDGRQAERIAALEAENADLKDRLLRLAADMENLRRRTEREMKDARQYAVTSFAREMLSVADNLRRAIDAVPAEAREKGEAGLTALTEGVEVTERGMLSTLEKFGVRRLEPQGQRFDPNFHQAMFEVPKPDVPSGTVVQVVQDGYAIGDRVLRPAMVGVSKGGPKQAGEANSSEEAGRESADDAA